MKTRKEEEYLMLSREEMSKNERNALDTYYWVLDITKEILGAENMTENVLMVAIGTAGDVARQRLQILDSSSSRNGGKNENVSAEKGKRGNRCIET